MFFPPCPEPEWGKRNLGGALIRKFRTDGRLSQEALATKLQVAGWNIDRTMIVRIESGARPLLDYELKFFLDVFGKKMKDIDWE